MNEFYNITLKSGVTYKILFVTDVHLIDREFKNSIRYVESVERFLHQLIEGAKSNVYNVVIFLGDLFDREYEDVAKALYHISLFEELFELLEGRVFKVVGNHPINKKKSYIPTFFLIGKIKAKRLQKHTLVQMNTGSVHTNYGLNKPILYAPDRIIVNGNVINLFHFDKEDKTYTDILTDLNFEPKTHIGCYHDSIMTSVAKNVINEISNGNRFNIPSVETVENTHIFNNVDYAMIGDLHTTIGEFEVKNTLNGKVTIGDIPGSIGRTSNHKAQQHNEVYLPFMEITPEGKVTKSHMKVNLLDWRKIYKTEVQEENKLDKKIMTGFKEVIESLTVRDTFEETLEESDLEERSKEIIESIISEGTASISYRGKAVEKGLLNRL